MVSLTTIFTMGGFGIAIAMLELIFKAMGKATIGMIIGAIGTCFICGLALHTIWNFFDFLQSWLSSL